MELEEIIQRQQNKINVLYLRNHELKETIRKYPWGKIKSMASDWRVSEIKHNEEQIMEMRIIIEALVAKKQA